MKITSFGRALARIKILWICKHDSLQLPTESCVNYGQPITSFLDVQMGISYELEHGSYGSILEPSAHILKFGSHCIH